MFSKLLDKVINNPVSPNDDNFITIDIIIISLLLVVITALIWNLITNKKRNKITEPIATFKDENGKIIFYIFKKNKNFIVKNLSSNKEITFNSFEDSKNYINHLIVK